MQQHIHSLVCWHPRYCSTILFHYMWCHILLHYMHTVPYCSTICGHTVPLYAHGAIYCSTICTWCHTAPLYVAILFHYILLHYMWCHITPLYVVPYCSTVCGAILLHYTIDQEIFVYEMFARLIFAMWPSGKN